jgi:hypothetical protein
MQDGTWKKIEDVKLGEVLLGEHGSLNAVKEYHRPVLGLNDHVLPHKLRLASINGSEFSVSEDHMIKTTAGWRTPTVEMCKILHAETLKNESIEISQLQIGDEIICSDGSTTVVEDIRFKEDAPELQLYNFKLHGNKTYHVRMKGTDKFILVHNKDPLAQTFAIKNDDGSDGVYLTKINLYFKEKDSTRGVTVDIRETVNGVPSAKIIATKVLTNSSINVSDTGQTATTVTFDTPVYLKNSQDYCVVVIPDQYCPNFRLWVAEVGIPDVANTSLISNRNWGDGVLFLSSNDRVWTPYQGEDLKFDVYIADFSKSSGTLVLENDNYEFLTLSGTTGTFVATEEVAQKSNTYLSGTFTCNTSSAIINTSSSQTSSVSSGDYVLVVYANTDVLKTGSVTGNTTSPQINGSSTVFTTEYDVGDYLLINGNIREVESITNNTILTLDAPLSNTVTSNAHYGVSDVFQISRVNSVNSTSITLKDTPLYQIDGGTNYYGAVQKVVRGVIDVLGQSDTLIVRDSNAQNTTFRFETNKIIVGERSQARATISSIDNKVVNFTESHIRKISPAKTSVTFTQKIDGVTETAANSLIALGTSNPVPYVGQVKSKSNEITSGSKSLKIYARMSAESGFEYISPAVDIEPASAVVIENLINNDYSNETSRYGNADVRYVSKNVVLADGLDAEDMKVYITAYKPSQSNILVYAKILASDDNEAFENKDWTLLDQVTEAGLYSASADERDFKEYEYTFKKTPPSSALDGVITSSSNTTITGSGTSFTTDLAANDIVKIVLSDTLTDYDITVVDSVANNTSLTLKSNTSFTSTVAKIEKVTQPSAAFKYNKDSNVITYFDNRRGAHSTYKTFAVKVVLVSSSSKYVPLLKDVRALAVSV